MNSKTVIYIILTTWLPLVSFLQPVMGDDVTSQEYQIKAAFLFNFLKFVEWPKSKTKDPNEPIIIGIIGENVFKDDFDSIKNKSIEGKKVIVKQYKGLSEQDNPSKEHPQIKAIRESHLLFISPSEKIFTPNILGSVKEYGVLTVADYKGFLEAGGIINLIMAEKKVQFEINMIAAKQAGITIRSQLLRLAKKVIKQETSSANINLPNIAQRTTFFSLAMFMTSL